MIEFFGVIGFFIFATMFLIAIVGDYVRDGIAIKKNKEMMKCVICERDLEYFDYLIKGKK